jgi:putative cardiolipin synthase
MTRRLGLAIAVCAAATAMLFARGAALPTLTGRTESSAVLQTADTRLGELIGPRVAAHPGASGVYPLLDGGEAFAARMLLAQTAQRSLDIQYYIWRGDRTGTLMFDALRAAAERGVRVRLLLDDNNTAGVDGVLAALDAHPNIEVRLFNPFVNRAWRALGYLTDFGRLNRRMHNKSFTADGQATIVGGRNVGDEYFDATDGVLFADLDVLAVGPIVPEVARDFDRYWAAESSYPVDRLLPPAGRDDLPALEKTAAAIAASPGAVRYADALRRSDFVRDLTAGKLPLLWAPTRMISDDPEKALGRADPEGLFFRQLVALMGDPGFELDLVSPYFVPTETGVNDLAAMRKRGVTVRVLTNALEATDVAAVHAGYARRRKPLLRAGVALYEMRRVTTGLTKRPGSFGGSSGTSLHAKTFAVDDTRVFIGSFNFDPRSARLNTELGFVIHSPELAQRIAAAFERAVPLNAYELRLTPGGDLYWIENRDGGEIRHDTEPGTSLWQRVAVRLLSLLPIEWML